MGSIPSSGTIRLGPDHQPRSWQGRLFNDYDEDTLAAFIAEQQEWLLIELWRTEDIGQHRPNVQWVNVLPRGR